MIGGMCFNSDLKEVIGEIATIKTGTPVLHETLGMRRTGIRRNQMSAQSFVPYTEHFADIWSLCFIGIANHRKQGTVDEIHQFFVCHFESFHIYSLPLTEVLLLRFREDPL